MKTISKHALLALVILSGSSISANDDYSSTINMLEFFKQENEYLEQKKRTENIDMELREKFSDVLKNLTDDEARSKAYVIANQMDDDDFQRKVKVRIFTNDYST